MGKITKVTAQGYIVRDDKDGKNRQFRFHDRAKQKNYSAKGKEMKKFKEVRQKEAVSAAQQAAIAISKKERGEKPKNESKESRTFEWTISSKTR